MKEPDKVGSLERAILGGEPVFTAAELAADTGITINQAQRLWRALGFPEHGTARAFTTADAEAVSKLVAMVDAGLIDFDLGVNMTRAVGQTMARLAEWEVGTLLHRVEELESGEEATGSRTGSAIRLIQELGPGFEETMLYVWRRHLAAAVSRFEALGAADEDLHSTQLTVGFADIVGFTALSNSISREQVGDLVELFETRCADVVAGSTGRVIKSLGDSVLFVNTDAIAAYDTAEGIINVIGKDQRMPDVRVGLASGSVVMRQGDVYGPPVNLASRLTQVARRNRVMIDNATAELLPADQFETRRLTARPVRGFGLVEPVHVRRH